MASALPLSVLLTCAVSAFFLSEVGSQKGCPAHGFFLLNGTFSTFVWGVRLWVSVKLDCKKQFISKAK